MAAALVTSARLGARAALVDAVGDRWQGPIQEEFRREVTPAPGVVPMVLDRVESWTRWIGALGILVTLGTIFVGLWRGLRRPRGRTTGRWLDLLRSPAFYLLAALGYFGLCYLLWRRLPLPFSPLARALLLVVGGLLLLLGLGLVLWGRLALGRMYDVSLTMGARLYVGHSLITTGPYALVRHPMYVGLLFTGWGGLLVYRTWTFVFVAATFLGLVVRARREEEVLAEEFGPEWEAYRRRVPGWVPRIRRRQT